MGVFLYIYLPQNIFSGEIEKKKNIKITHSPLPPLGLPLRIYRRPTQGTRVMRLQPGSDLLTTKDMAAFVDLRNLALIRKHIHAYGATSVWRTLNVLKQPIRHITRNILDAMLFLATRFLGQVFQHEI